MPTTKNRINLSVTPELNTALKKLARRDGTSVSAKTLALVHAALELEEDEMLVHAVRIREKHPGKFVSHAAAWV